MRGLIIQLPNITGKNLWKLFNNINLSRYKWRVFFDEVLYNEDGVEKNSLFEHKIINDKDFLRRISQVSYYLIFLDIKAFPVHSDIDNVATYDEFKTSQCEIVLLCSDSIFVNFYCKDKDIIQQVRENCLENGFETEYLTEENDGRLRLSV